MNASGGPQGRRTRQRRAVCSQRSHHGFHDVPIKSTRLAPPTFHQTLVPKGLPGHQTQRPWYTQARGAPRTEHTRAWRQGTLQKGAGGAVHGNERYADISATRSCCRNSEKEVTGVQRTMFSASAHLSSRAIPASSLIVND